MPSVSVVELTNTFDDWRNRTNDVITEINGANSVDPTSAIVYANSSSGFQVNEVVSDAITGTAITGTRLIFTGGNINFTSGNTQSLGNVHQTHILGGTSIDVSLPENADTSISNTFIYNSKINLNGQKLVSGAAEIDLEGATVTNLGAVAKFIGTAITNDDIVLTNPTINVNSGTVGGLTVSAGIHEFGGATVNGASMNTITMSGSTVQGSNAVVNGAGFLATTNSVALAVDAGTANVGIGKFTEVSTSIATEKRPTSSKGRLHIRTDFSAGSAAATAVEASADELLLEGNTAVGLTLLANNASNAHIAFGDPDNTDIGGIIYNHSTDSMHFNTDGANTVVMGNEFGGYMQVVGNDTVATQVAKFQVTVGSTDGGADNANQLHGIFLDANQPDQKAMLIDGEQTTSNIFEIQADALTTGSAIYVDDNSGSSGPRKLVHILADHADAGGTALHVESDGMESSKFKQNATDQNAINAYSDVAHTIPLVSFTSDATTSASETLKVKGDSATTTTKVLTVANNTHDMVSVVAGGGVGINDTTPSYKLDVNGTLRSTANAHFDTNIHLAEKLFHSGDENTFLLFGADTMDFNCGGNIQLKLTTTDTELYYDGSEKLATTSSGVSITGSATISSNLTVSGGSVCANGVECAIRIEDSDGTLLNSC
tara:strand:- start:1387 stop:3363 length:1977 start_codon:yes stop_codon:yes gene_type:complete